MRATPPETEVAAVMEVLFRRWPALVGFCVAQDPATELIVSDVAIEPWQTRSQELLSEIADALFELVSQEPAAADVLRGRTFARSVH